MKRLYTSTIFLGIASSRSGSITSAVVPPQSGSFWGRKSDYQRSDDVPIVGDSFRRRKRGTRRRSRLSKAEDTDSDDEPIPFFYDREDDIDWRAQYELDKKLRRRHHKNNNRLDNEAEFGVISPWKSLRQWTYNKTGVRIPRINFHFDPITILKVRKSWHNIVPGAIVRVGADFETQHRLGGGIWRLRGCLEDKLFGGRFTLKSKQNDDKGAIMEYTKSWLIAGTGSLATRFNFCAQYDIQSNRGSARFGFRTENMNAVGTIISSPNGFSGSLSRRQGFTVIPIIPLDGPNGHFKLEAKTSIELPEPEITVGVDLGGLSVDSGGSVGMGIGGDVDVEIDELNIICLF